MVNSYRLFVSKLPTCGGLTVHRMLLLFVWSKSGSGRKWCRNASTQNRAILSTCVPTPLSGTRLTTETDKDTQKLDGKTREWHDKCIRNFQTTRYIAKVRKANPNLFALQEQRGSTMKNGQTPEKYEGFINVYRQRGEKLQLIRIGERQQR